jgi:hypothetical protein
MDVVLTHGARPEVHKKGRTACRIMPEPKLVSCSSQVLPRATRYRNSGAPSTQDFGILDAPPAHRESGHGRRADAALWDPGAPCGL